MPAADRHIPKYRHYKPKDLAVVRIDGRDHYLGKYGTPESRERYHRLLAEHAVKGSADLGVETTRDSGSQPLSVNKLVLAYFRHVKAYYIKNGQPTSEVGIIRQVLRIIRRLYGDTAAKDFGPLALKACREAMVTRGWSRKSINRQVMRIRAIFKWAAAREMLPATIHEALRTVEGLRKGRSTARERPPVLPVPDDVVEKTLAHLPEVPAAMVRLQRLTGMRPQEVVELRPLDIDMTDATCWIYRPDRHKGEHHDRERVVFIGPRAIEVLRPFIGLDISGHVFSPRQSEAQRNLRRSESRKTPMYRSHVDHQDRRRKARPRRALGDRYTVGTYRQAIHRACDAAFPHPTLAPLRPRDLSREDRQRYRELRRSCRDRKIPLERRREMRVAADDLLMPPEQRSELRAWQDAHCWNPHALRHATATQIRGRYGVEAARTVLGHSDADTTTIYAERDLELARRVMREIG
jgi:integrase